MKQYVSANMANTVRKFIISSFMMDYDFGRGFNSRPTGNMVLTGTLVQEHPYLRRNNIMQFMLSSMGHLLQGIKK